MKRIFKFFVKLLSTVLVIGIIVVVCVGAYYGVNGYKEYKRVLEECPLETKIAELTSRENYIKMDELPQIYIDAVIAVEDHNYYDHGAISFVSTMRAILTNIKDRDYTEGGSTITSKWQKIFISRRKRSLPER